MKIIEKQNTLTIQAESSQNHYIDKEHEPHVIKLMYEKLYSNKPLAVIREYICNAMDSHRVAGKPISDITVHLPTEFEPWFSVKDVGVGMSPDDVKKFYSSYGHSTKRDDERQIGMFGIGSKAAFCICDTFEVIARKDGVETYAVCSVAVKPGESTGSTNIVYTQPTTEPNGVEVKVPVDEGSGDFQREAVSLCNFMEEIPNFGSFSEEVESYRKLRYYSKIEIDVEKHKTPALVHKSRNTYSKQVSIGYLVNGVAYIPCFSHCDILVDVSGLNPQLSTSRESITNEIEIHKKVSEAIDAFKTKITSKFKKIKGSLVIELSEGFPIGIFPNNQTFLVNEFAKSEASYNDRLVYENLYFTRSFCGIFRDAQFLEEKFTIPLFEDMLSKSKKDKVEYLLKNFKTIEVSRDGTKIKEIRKFNKTGRTEIVSTIDVVLAIKNVYPELGKFFKIPLSEEEERKKKYKHDIKNFRAEFCGKTFKSPHELLDFIKSNPRYRGAKFPWTSQHVSKKRPWIVTEHYTLLCDVLGDYLSESSEVRLSDHGSAIRAKRNHFWNKLETEWFWDSTAEILSSICSRKVQIVKELHGKPNSWTEFFILWMFVTQGDYGEHHYPFRQIAKHAYPDWKEKLLLYVKTMKRLSQNVALLIYKKHDKYT